MKVFGKPKVIYNIKAVKDLSLNTFKSDFFLNKKPVKIEGALREWKALKKWSDMDWWEKNHGYNLVPVELDRYDKISDKVEIPLSLFIKLFMTPKQVNKVSDKLTLDELKYGYMAQYPLLDFIPSLKEDIKVPDYIKQTGVSVEQIMAWMGPTNTITPIHHDPYNNLFAQIYGQKHVKLYAPQFKDYMYPFNDKFRNNTSKVDAENIDIEKFPEFLKVEQWEADLKEGDLLFIPKGWWHYIKSLSPSISLSFWW